MPRIAFISPLGNRSHGDSGPHAFRVCSTGLPVLGIDLCPQNQLGRYLGLMEPPAKVGQHPPWRGNGGPHALENSAQAAFLPFGQPQPVELQLAQRWAQEPGWLDWQLGRMEVSDDTVVFLDTPVWPAPLAQQAVLCADVLLVMLDASLRSCQPTG